MKNKVILILRTLLEKHLIAASTLKINVKLLLYVHGFAYIKLSRINLTCSPVYL